MPYANEHACRLREPGDFQDGSFRRVTREHEGKQYSIIMGKLKGSTSMTEQAYRYNKNTWSASSARSHCTSHDGKSFEAAAEGGDMTHQWETFSAPFELLEAKPEEGTFKGRAAVYGREFLTMYGPLIIEPGAFSESIKNDADRHVILWQHDPGEPIGRPIEVSDGPDGIDILGKISQTARGRDVLTLLRDRVVKEMSIGLDRITEAPREDRDEPVRLTKGKLWEFSLVTFGAAGGVGARVSEVHHAVPKVKIIEPPLEVMRARVLQADYEEKFGKLTSEPATIPVSEIAKLCASCAEKLEARGITAVSVDEFSRVIEMIHSDQDS